MIKREDLVPGAKFRQIDNVTDVEILCVGAKSVFLRHTNDVENLWSVDSCLTGLKKIPPPKRKGVVKLFIYEIRGDVYSVTMHDGRPGFSREIKILAEFEVPWEEGQGIE